MEYFSLGVGGGPERTKYCVGNIQNRSSHALFKIPRNRFAFGYLIQNSNIIYTPEERHPSGWISVLYSIHPCNHFMYNRIPMHIQF